MKTLLILGKKFNQKKKQQLLNTGDFLTRKMWKHTVSIIIASLLWLLHNTFLSEA